MPVIVPPQASTGRRVVTLLVGLAIIATGVACCIRAELGVAPYDVLSTGLAELFDIPIGVAAIVLPCVFLGLGVALGGHLGPGSLLAVVLVGPMLGLVLSQLPEPEAIVPRLVLFAIGFVVITIGVTVVILPEIGSAPAELLMLALHDRGYPLARARTGIEVVSVAVGWAIGGQVGVGTVVFAVLIGPALRVTLAFGGYDPLRAAEASDAAAPGA